MAIVDPKLWKVDNQQTRAAKGPLVRVFWNGHWVKMYEKDAIDKGLIKSKPQASNKMRPVPGNKTEPHQAPAEETHKADDFTSIPGIGPASARSLAAHGVTTFEQLLHATGFDYLTTKARDALEDWKVANG